MSDVFNDRNTTRVIDFLDRKYLEIRKIIKWIIRFESLVNNSNNYLQRMISAEIGRRSSIGKFSTVSNSKRNILEIDRKLLKPSKWTNDRKSYAPILERLRFDQEDAARIHLIFTFFLLSIVFSRLFYHFISIKLHFINLAFPYLCYKALLDRTWTNI